MPDTHQKSVLAALDKEEAIRVVTCATEDEAATIGAGLHLGGEPVVLMIQHAGLYASVNTLRGVSMDGKIPDLLHDRPAEPGEGQGPEGVAPLDGAVRGAAARHVLACRTRGWRAPTTST